MPAQAYCEVDFPRPGHAERLAAAFSDPLHFLSAATPEEVPGVIQQAEQHARAGCWVIGFVAYEAAPAFDPALHVREMPSDGMPLAAFAVFRDTDASPRARGSHLCGAWRDETRRADFEAAVARIRDGITAGDYYQVNYTTRLRAPLLGNGLSFFDGLRASQREAHCAYLDFGRWQVCSVSPELFFHWAAGQDGARTLTCRPMKGTAARCSDPGLDRDAAHALQHSPKERAENLMIVDLVRNDLSRVAQPGSVRAAPLFSIEQWPTVWQMTSTVSCNTKATTTLTEVFHALFPCGSVTGAPKAAAMSAIHSLETSTRGIYCGAVGMLLPGGEALFSVGIRTPVIDTASRSAECGIGSGITLDSVAALEHDEWGAKQAFLAQSCPQYQLLETLRLHQGRYWLLRGHLQRLAQSARVLGFVFEETGIVHALRSEAQLRPSGNWRVRLLLSADGAIQTESFPLDALPAAPEAELALAAVRADNPWLSHKTSRREIYSALASVQPGIFDTLLHNERGELTEFTRGNLVVELDGRLLTPPLDCGLLPGVFRAALLKRNRISEGVVRVEDLARASQVWFVNSVRGAVRVEMRPQ